MVKSGMKNAVFCLMGPTASGKTALACELVQRFPFEIISVDSALIYRGMNIGTAKPDKATLMQAPHRLIDILDPPMSYSAAQFCLDANRACDAVVARGNVPLLVGGTMMYFRALQQGLSMLPEANASVRFLLSNEEKEQGLTAMHARLASIDPLSAAKIHPNDSQRIHRALEVYEMTGHSLSSHWAMMKEHKSLYSFISLMVMPANRAWLHTRIEQRFVQMLASGLVDEVESLFRQWPQLTPSHPAMRCVGYRQVCDHLSGQSDWVRLQEKGTAATRQLAKRQLTWLRHWPNGHGFEAENPRIIEEMLFMVDALLCQR